MDRRQLLRGLLAAGVAAVPISALAGSARGAEAVGGALLEDFHLALLDVQNHVIETYWTGHIKLEKDQNGKDRFVFGAPLSAFPTGGWAPLECKFRKIGGVPAFLVCGGDEEDGRVTIHRTSDSAALGWTTGLKNFPHSLEYLPTADAVIVVGTAGLDDQDPGPPGERTGGSFLLFQAPTAERPGPLVKISGPHAFREAHGVVLDQNNDRLLWIYGGNKILAYEVSGQGTGTTLTYLEHRSLTNNKFENGHDLQPDLAETQYLWATGSKSQFRINKSGGGRPRIDWEYPTPKVKSFSKHRSGRGIYTADTLGNKYGSSWVDFVWPNQPVEAKPVGEQKEKWIYKARLTDI
ncbi:hypothetical protein [Amycolatopsis magusensis]|uniref:Uncharacterized protein n=1 Tax=Amycolatopsis magusensis TaxID=882444 RepID=A0ABS4Q1A6_9PSEU|nr:hypothetical protein [Amycolatopsis magusensis]MBP2185451.1 hypothetical protein [Amycolatopsis magusensis]